MAAAGLIGFFAGLKVSSPALAVAGGVLTAVAFIAWSWPRGEKRGAPPDRPQEPASLDGLPVEEHSGRSVGWLGVVMGVAVLASFQLTSLTSYGYLRFNTAQWPPQGFPLPEPVLPAVTVALLVVSVLPTWTAARAAAACRARRLAVVLTALLALGCAYVGLLATDLASSGFGADEHAYASLVFLLHGAQIAFAAAGVVAIGVLLVRTLAGHFSVVRHSGVHLVAVYWSFVVASGVATTAVVVLGPRIL